MQHGYRAFRAVPDSSSSPSIRGRRSASSQAAEQERWRPRLMPPRTSEFAAAIADLDGAIVRTPHEDWDVALVNFANPDEVIIGGGVLRMGARIVRIVEEVIRERAPKLVVEGSSSEDRRSTSARVSPGRAARDGEPAHAREPGAVGGGGAPARTRRGGAADRRGLRLSGPGRPCSGCLR